MKNECLHFFSDSQVLLCAYSTQSYSSSSSGQALLSWSWPTFVIVHPWVCICVKCTSFIISSSALLIFLTSQHWDGSVHARSKAQVKKRPAEGSARMWTPTHLKKENAAKVRGELQQHLDGSQPRKRWSSALLILPSVSFFPHLNDEPEHLALKSSCNCCVPG